MGINGLNKFLLKQCPSAFINLPMSYFKGKRIAIDSDNILRRLMSRAHKEIVDKTNVSVMEPERDDIIKKWVYHTKNFVLDLIRYGITPIFVFDGKYIDEKSETQEKRRADKNKRIAEAEDMKTKIMEIDELERTPAMVTELRKKMHHLGFLNSDEKEIMIGILSAVGIPVLKAKGEGEQLCAMLCIEGKVDAVYSRDTDLVVFGCPLTISEPAGYIHNPKTDRVEESFKCTLFKPILSELGMTYETFRDLCIMAGCDFNNNIPHLGVGKSYNILKECGSIDNLPAKYHIRSKCIKHPTCKAITEKYEDQVECLNHVKCREILGHYPSQTITNNDDDDLTENFNININLIDARDRLEAFGAEDWVIDLLPLYQNLPTPSETNILKYPSLSRSSVKLNIIDPKNKQVSNNQVVNNTTKPKLLILNNETKNIKSVNNETKNIETKNIETLNQKASPPKISMKRAQELSRGQHKNLFEKYPHLKDKI